MFDNSDTFFNQKLFWIIINKLSVNENSWFVSCYSFNFLFHFDFFGLRDLSNFIERLNSDSGSINFNFIIVHGRIRGKNFAVFDLSLATNRDGLFEYKSVTEEGIFD